MPVTELTLGYDEGINNPLDDDDGAWSIVHLKTFHNGYSYRERVSYDYLTDELKAPIGLRSKLRAGTAFVIRERYDDFEIVTPPEDAEDWEGLIIWNHPPSHMGAKTVEERRKDAQGSLNLFNDWRNGRAYFFDFTGDLTEGIGWFIGDGSGIVEAMVQTVRDYLSYHPEVKRTSVIRRRYGIEDRTEEDPEVLAIYVTGDATFLLDDELEMTNV